QRLVVLHDMDDSDRVPFDWSPAQIDRGKPGSTLGSWFPLPWGGPDQIVLPGFHTPAESAMKKGGSGDELFLTACGLMSTGTRTILLSRWRVGGKTTFDLVREFVQELPHTTASAAWQRSVNLRRMANLDPDQEPRAKVAPGDSVAAEHPFFWAGYLLIDNGMVPGDTPVVPAADVGERLAPRRLPADAAPPDAGGAK